MQDRMQTSLVLVSDFRNQWPRHQRGGQEDSVCARVAYIMCTTKRPWKLVVPFWTAVFAMAFQELLAAAYTLRSRPKQLAERRDITAACLRCKYDSVESTTWARATMHIRHKAPS